MQIQLMSDLHLSFHKDKGKQFIDDLDPTNVDVLVLAGDIGELKDITFSIPLFCKKYKNIIMVHGNHHYYGSDKETIEKETLNLTKEFTNLHHLNNSLVEIDNQRFLGGTMWFKKTDVAQKLEDNFSDFHHIKNLNTWVYKDNLNFRVFLRDNLKENDVVITHHLPSEKCVDKVYEGDPYNCFFVSDIEEIIKERKPKLVCSGHTHRSYSISIGDTKAVCNPFGYIKHGEVENKNFNSKLLIEI